MKKRFTITPQTTFEELQQILIQFFDYQSLYTYLRYCGKTREKQLNSKTMTISRVLAGKNINNYFSRVRKQIRLHLAQYKQK